MVEEENAIQALIGRLDDIGIPPKLSYLYQMAVSIICQRSFSELGSKVKIGEHWLTHFLNRHPNLAYRYAARIDNEWAFEGNRETVNHYFNRLSAIRSRFHITPDNTWNADEKGFAIGQAKQCKVLLRQNRRRSRVRQPGNWEWVSVIECVSATGTVIHAYLIYKGKVHTMGNHDYENREEGTFGLSDNGWSDDRHGFAWLSTHFDPKARSGSLQHRLLIIDHHSSHLTVEFIEYCLTYNIHLLCLPSHFTDLLQPFDIGLFSPLKQYYSNTLNTWTRTHPYQKPIKGDFFPLLMEARRLTFTEKTLKSPFASTDIHPFRRNWVLEILEHKSTAPQPNLATQPISTGDVQHLKVLLEKSDNMEKVKHISYLLAISAESALANEVIAKETLQQFTTSQKKSKTDKWQISKARVLTRTDLDRLREERLKQEEKKTSK